MKKLENLIRKLENRIVTKHVKRDINIIGFDIDTG